MKIGQKIPQIELLAIDGSQFDSNSLLGKRYLVTFFRFATCPFCNIRLAQLVKSRKELGEGFEIVAIFESDLNHLQKHASKHLASFPILADPDRVYYKKFEIRKSVKGMLKGMVFRLPTAIKGMFKGYVPREISARMLIMPTSLLVDEEGIVQSVYRGQDEGDHIPIEDVARFAEREAIN